MRHHFSQCSVTADYLIINIYRAPLVVFAVRVQCRSLGEKRLKRAISCNANARHKLGKGSIQRLVWEKQRERSLGDITWGGHWGRSSREITEGNITASSGKQL